MDYIKIFVDFEKVITTLGDAERGRLFTAMLAYASTGAEPEFDGNERYISTWLQRAPMMSGL
ncbi:MAG: DUF6291 domain-containing protein [Oscillospiraceae bacterium]|nr:DUF6291 domain-containing protein [Oscillospiraceae bacterium]